MTELDIDEIKDRLLNQPLTAQVAIDAVEIITYLKDRVESLRYRLNY